MEKKVYGMEEEEEEDGIDKKRKKKNNFSSGWEFTKLLKANS